MSFLRPRSNLGVEKSNWDDLQPGGYGVSNDVVFGHLDEFVRDQDSINLSTGAWEDLKEDLEGFPFNGRTLNRTNIDSCILQYLRHTSNLSLAASFSSYLRNNGNSLPSCCDCIFALCLSHITANCLQVDCSLFTTNNCYCFTPTLIILKRQMMRWVTLCVFQGGKMFIGKSVT